MKLMLKLKVGIRILFSGVFTNEIFFFFNISLLHDCLICEQKQNSKLKKNKNKKLN